MSRACLNGKVGCTITELHKHEIEWSGDMNDTLYSREAAEHARHRSLEDKLEEKDAEIAKLTARAESAERDFNDTAKLVDLLLTAMRAVPVATLPTEAALTVYATLKTAQRLIANRGS